MKKLTLTTLIVTVCLSSNAMAKRNSHHDFAKVIKARPVYETITHKIAMDGCHHRDHRKSSQHTHNSAVPTVVGGIIGGAVGHAIGHNKSNKKVGLVAGTLLGAAIGSEIEVSHHRHKPHHSCRPRYRYKHEEILVGYDVTYRYHGHKYHTHTKHHPGSRLKVKVRVEPVRGHHKRDHHKRGH